MAEGISAMKAYELGHDEIVIMQDANVSEGNTKVSLILTNQNIIQVNKGFFGGEKNSEKYPLIQLKEHNGKPNILIGKEPNGEIRLELYFVGYEKYYSFPGRTTEKKWAGAIEKAYKELNPNQKKEDKVKIDIGGIFTPLKGPIGMAAKALTPKPKERKSKMNKCPRCGAELVGKQGEEIKCVYCDAIITIK